MITGLEGLKTTVTLRLVYGNRYRGFSNETLPKRWLKVFLTFQAKIEGIMATLDDISAPDINAEFSSEFLQVFAKVDESEIQDISILVTCLITG